MLEYAKQLVKMYFDRRRFRGSSEFFFRPRLPTRDFLKVDVLARAGTFKTTVMLRRGTTDLQTFGQIFTSNDYNLRRLARWDDICAVYKTISRDGIPLILDLGANIGLSSLYFAKNWPEAHIISVEPSNENYRAMCKNVDGFGNIQPVKAAVSSKDGFVKIKNPEAQSWAYQTAQVPPGSTGGIDALSVESLLKIGRNPASYRPFIAKIDIEGFEKDLFSENTQWIELFPIIVVELHDWMMPRQANSTNFLRTIGQHDRDFIYYGENIFSISNTL